MADRQLSTETVANKLILELTATLHSTKEHQEQLPKSDSKTQDEIATRKETLRLVHEGAQIRESALKQESKEAMMNAEVNIQKSLLGGEHSPQSPCFGSDNSMGKDDQNLRTAPRVRAKQEQSHEDVHATTYPGIASSAHNGISSSEGMFGGWHKGNFNADPKVDRSVPHVVPQMPTGAFVNVTMLNLRGTLLIDMNFTRRSCYGGATSTMA